MEASYDEILAAINASKEMFPVLQDRTPPNLPNHMVPPEEVPPEAPLQDSTPDPPPEDVRPEDVPPGDVPPDVAEPPKEGGTSAFGVIVLSSET